LCRKGLTALIVNDSLLLSVKSNPPPDTSSLTLAWSEADAAEIEAVASTLPGILTCPYCGGRRRPNGRRVIRYRDVPVEGVPRLVDWHRQHYRCTACGRASNEENPAFEKERFITERFAAWVREKSASSNLSAIAKEAGMNKVVLRRLFHTLTADQPNRERHSPVALAIALVTLAGRPRPVLADIERPYVLDVFASMDLLKAALERESPSSLSDVALVVRDIEFNQPGLLDVADLRHLWPYLNQHAISSHSVARRATEMMFELCEPWFKQTAEAEGQSPTSVRKLFARRRGELKKSASRRVDSWEHREETRALFDAYRLKEGFNQIWRDGEGLRGWQDWIAQANKLREQRFQGIIDLVEADWRELNPCFEHVEIVNYERWLDAVQAYEIKGTHSFAAARLALLAKYGEPSETTPPPPLSEEEYDAIGRLADIGGETDD
jgi:Transposase